MSTNKATLASETLPSLHTNHEEQEKHRPQTDGYPLLVWSFRLIWLFTTLFFVAPTLQTQSVVQAQSFSCATVTEIPVSECEGLVHFYNSMGGPDWRNQDGWLITPMPCSWHGVSCAASQVQTISLANNNLSGSLPTNWGLPRLINLYLDNNQINRLPSDFVGLDSLTYIGLSYNQINEFPANFTGLNSLTVLDLSFNYRIIKIPADFTGLNSLTGLDLRGNQIAEFPANFTGLDSLVGLDLSFNQIVEFPANFTGLDALERLGLAGNRIIQVPSNFTGLNNLSFLFLRSNRITQIPSKLNGLDNLYWLELRYNQITQIPTEWNLPSLRELLLSDNQIIGIPTTFTGLGNLTGLDLSHNQISQIPNNITGLQGLKILFLSHNQIAELPSNFSGLDNLEELVLFENKISQIPPQFAGLDRIIYLNLGKNQITHLPSNFTGIDRIIYLYLDSNLITDMPANFSGLDNLESLRLYNNQISQLPSNFIGLDSLRQLELSKNQISQLPSDFRGLEKLEKLYLNGNQITQLPTNLTGLNNLLYLGLYNNQISQIPSSWMPNNLLTLELGSNNIRQIPTSFAGLHNLNTLNLGNHPLTPDNYLDADILKNQITIFDTDISSLPSLDYLYLDGNKLHQLIPQLRLDSNPVIQAKYNALDEQHIASDVKALIQEGWQTTQTVAPTNIVITPTDTLDIRWQPIPYLENEGHYEVGLATTPCTENCANHYKVVATTPSKTTPSVQISLATLLPDTTYYLAVRSHTRAHADNPNPLTSQYSEPVEFRTPLPTPETLVLYALSFDNDPTRPCSLSGYYPEVQAKILEQSAQSPTTLIAILVDLVGNNNTHIFLAQAGRQIPASAPGLPNKDGTLDSALTEYDMTNPNTLGGFIRWARKTFDHSFPGSQSDPFPTQAQATLPTFFSFIGHGLPLAPQDSTFGQTISLQRTLEPTTDFTITPSFRGSHPCWTDETIPDSNHPKVLTANQLAQALELGTYQGTYPLQLVDVSHCFAASYETFYDLSNPDGLVYAQALVGSPNYSYFAPELMAAFLETVDATLSGQTGQTIATHLVQNYDRVFTQNPDIESEKHPRIYVAVDSAALQATKPVFDTLVDAIWLANEDDRLLTAYQNVGYYYDTTFCAPQDWQVAPGDGLVDLYKFTLALRDSYDSDNSVRDAANNMANGVAAAVLANTATDGIPWFADPQPTQPMAFATNADNPVPGVGLSFYADLQGVVENGQTRLSHPAYWYTSNGRTDTHTPYALIKKPANQETTWADILNRYWEAKGLLLSAPPSNICLPDLPPVVEEGATSFAPEYPYLLTPRPDTMTVASPVTLSTAIHVAQDVHNMIVVFEVFNASNERDFLDHVSTGFLPAGNHQIKTTKTWTPKSTGIYTIRITLDADNRLEELDEDNNVALVNNQTVETQFTRPSLFVAPLESQWVDTPSLTIMVSQDEGTTPMNNLLVTIKQYEPSANPHVQVPVTKGVIELRQLLTTIAQAVVISLDEFPNLKSGITILEIDAKNGRDYAKEPVILRFNYLRPDATTLASKGDVYFLLDAHQCESFSLTPVDPLDSNRTLPQAELVAWAPYNYQAPLYQPGQGNPLAISPVADDGTYVIRLKNWGDDLLSYALEPVHEATTCTSSGLAQRNISAGMPNRFYGVEDLRPFFIEPIPNRLIFSTYLPLIAAP